MSSIPAPAGSGLSATTIGYLEACNFVDIYSEFVDISRELLKFEI
jgi:hypothetical protein